ncbi:MAG: hypothetical protein ACKOB1_11375 [Planctomycetia bacterium]
MRGSRVVVVATLLACWPWGMQAFAQNDWQFPDPYFGILEIEKSRPEPPGRRPRPEVRSSQRGSSVARRPRWWSMKQRGTGASSRGSTP